MHILSVIRIAVTLGSISMHMVHSILNMETSNDKWLQLCIKKKLQSTSYGLNSIELPKLNVTVDVFYFM